MKTPRACCGLPLFVIIATLAATEASFGQDMEITDILIVNSTTNQTPATGGELVEGMVIDPTFPLTLRALSAPARVGSVELELYRNGALTHRQIENNPPYALFGDDGGDYNPAPDTRTGDYRVTVTPYTLDRGRGTPGSALTVHFSIRTVEEPEEPTPECSSAGDCDDGKYCNGAETCVNGSCTDGQAPCGTATCFENSDQCDVSGPQISSVEVHDVFTDEIWATLSASNATADVPLDDARHVTVEAFPGRDSVGSIGFDLYRGNSLVHSQNENNPPYMLFGNEVDGTLLTWPAPSTIRAATYRLVVTPYAARDREGATGDVLEVFLNLGDITPEEPECTHDGACADGIFCNGIETCVNGQCRSGDSPCGAGLVCVEQAGECDSVTPDPIDPIDVPILPEPDLGDPDGPQVTRLALIDADRNRPVAGYEDLRYGTVIDLATLTTDRLNIQALTAPATVGSVRITIGGVVRTENNAPYATYGDVSGDYNPWTPAPGAYLLTARAYDHSALRGSTGAEKIVLVHFIDSSSLPVSQPQRSQRVAVDEDGNGSETVMLDGSLSRSAGNITRWTWRDVTSPDHPALLGSGQTLSTVLPVGAHTLRLDITDSLGAHDSSTLPVMVWPNGTKALGHLGTFHKWHKIEIPMLGPVTHVGAEINPFDITVDVRFDGPSGSFTVPAFYDGDGAGGPVGGIWKVRFAANRTGSWSFTSISDEPALSGYAGTFSVNNAPSSAPQLLQNGLLSYVGEHYLRFADGPFWIKTGMDDPENILGTALGDWDAKKAVIDHVSSLGVNSVYALLQNLYGDRLDVWPWWGDAVNLVRASDKRRFDVGRLLDWESFFDHCQRRGVVLHLLFSDDNDNGFNPDFDHRLLYREMVARFGHHPALIWSLGEESDETYSYSEHLFFSGLLDDIDPYDHPITAHDQLLRDGERWKYLGEDEFDLASIQSSRGNYNFSEVSVLDMREMIMDHRERSTQLGRPLPIMIDEHPGVDKVNSTTIARFRREMTWPILLSGGSFELHYQDLWNHADGPTGTLVPSDLDPMWRDMYTARLFLEQLPVTSMDPIDGRVRGGDHILFADPGLIYALYLPDGDRVDLDLRGVGGTFDILWYNVRNGEFSGGGLTTGGSWRDLGSPDYSGDVAVIVARRDLNLLDQIADRLR